jgi:hypothetical protein
MVDSSSGEILAELNSKRQRYRFWPFAAAGAIAVIVISTILQFPWWLIVPLSLLLIAAVAVTHQYDLLQKTVVILYDLDSEVSDSFEHLQSALAHLAHCHGKWHIQSRGRVYDPKYHAGADQLVSRKAISAGLAAAPFVKSNVTPFVLRLADKAVYFFPEWVLVFAGPHVGAIGYENLSLVVGTKQFIEDGYLPSDARVIGNTWRYVNKSGGPDRRFNNNPQLPICHYEELWLNSATGLNEVLQVSRTGVGDHLNAAIQSLDELFKRIKAHRAVDAVPDDSWSPPNELAHESVVAAHADNREQDWKTLLQTLCCVMVSDGRASRAEKQSIEKMLISARAPWRSEQISRYIDSFIQWVGRDGFRKVLASTLTDVAAFRDSPSKAMLFDCLDELVKADGQLNDREVQLCARIRMIVDSPAPVSAVG